MPRMARPNKGIVCFEAPWREARDDFDGDAPLSVRPGIELVKRYIGYPNLFYRTASTMSEFRFHLHDYRGLTINDRRWYGILYLDFHGSEGCIHLPGEEEAVTLSDLADEIRETFKGFVIHLGSCSTLNSSRDDLDLFLKKTGASCILGYKEDIGWIESTVLDMLILNELIEDDVKNLGSFWKRFTSSYDTMCRRLGVSIYPSH